MQHTSSFSAPRGYCVAVSAALSIVLTTPAAWAQQFVYVSQPENNTVVGLYVNIFTGALRPIPGSLIPTRAIGQIAVDRTNRFLYLTTDVGILVYAINPFTGSLTITSAYPYPGGRNMVVDPSNRFLYTSGSGYIQGFRIDPLSGALTQIPEAHVSVGIAELLSLAIDPIGRFLYAGGRSLSIAVVAIDRVSGGLTAVEGSSFTTPSVGTANINPCPGFPPICPPFPPLPVVTEIEPHPNGRFLYALRSDGLLLFYINPFSGALNLVGQVGVARPTFGSTAVDPTGRFLYAVARLSDFEDGIIQAHIDRWSGILTPASVQPIEFESFLTALDPTGRFMFTTSGLHSATRTIVNYASNLFTGELVPVSAWPIGPFIAESIAVTGISWPALLFPQ